MRGVFPYLILSMKCFLFKNKKLAPLFYLEKKAYPSILEEASTSATGSLREPSKPQLKTKKKEKKTPRAMKIVFHV